MSLVKVSQPSIADMMPKGTIIWRGGIGFQRNRFGGFTPQITNLRFQKTPKGKFVGRIVLGGGAFFAEPVLFPNRIGNNHIRGVVAFFEHIPKRWTHFIVSGHSRAAREAGLNNKGAAVFLKSCRNQWNLEKYAKFRSEIAEEYRNHIHDEWESIYQIHASRFVPITYNKPVQRMIHVKPLDGSGKNEWLYDFHNIDQELS